MKEKRAPKTKPVGKLTIYPSITKQDAKVLFLNSVPTTPDGSNEPDLEVFCRVMDNLMTSGARSFDFNDVIRDTKMYDLEVSDVKVLFDRFVDVMIQCGKLEACMGVYDTPIYILP